MKSTLLRRALLACLLLFGGIGANKAYADHLSSIELYADYIGSGPNDMKYRVTVVLYRICIGNNLALGGTSYGSLQVSSASLNFNKTLRDTAVKFVGSKGTLVYDDTLDNLCPDFSAVNSCRVLANTTYSGYQRRVYQDTVTVPGRSTDLKFTWTSCCRLLTYANITGSNFYIEAGMDNTFKYNNNTPRYYGQPFTFCCVNQQSSLSNLPNDPDGDSLVTYSFTPQQFAASTVGYKPGYSATQPTGTSGYTVGPRSGKASFIASAQGKFVLGYRTEDWDRASGKKLGYCSRDLTITVLQCASQPPNIDSLPLSLTGVKNIDTTGGEVVLTACPQSPLSFRINANSNNPTGLIYMRPNGPLPPGMTVTPVVTGGTGYVLVNWTPTAADIGTHTVSLLAVDSTCVRGQQEITLRSEFTFTVIVRPGLDAGPDLLSCPLGERPVKLNTNANPALPIKWMDLTGAPALFLSCNDCPNPLAGPRYDYTYVVHSDDPLLVCKSEDTVTVFIDTSNSIVAPQDELIVCRPSYQNLISIAKGPAPLSNLPCGINSPILCAPADQDTAVVGGGTNAALVSTNTPFYSTSTYHKYQYILTKRELLNAGFYSGTINAIAFFHNNSTVVGTAPLENIRVSLACVYAEDLPANATNNDFITGTTQVANIASYTLTPNAWNQLTFSTPYSWDTTLNLLVEICMGPMTTPNAGNDPVAMMPGHSIQRYDNAIDVCGASSINVQSYTQRPVTKFIYCPSPELPFNYTWTPGTYLNDSTAQNPKAFISRSINYAVQTIGRNGCRVVDTLHVIVPEHHLSLFPKDSAVCYGQPAYLGAYGGAGYHWFEVQEGVFTSASGSLNCTDCQFPIATPKATTTYAVVYDNEIGEGASINQTYNTGCPDTMYLKIRVLPLPPVRAANADTTIGYGSSLQLYALGATRYVWTPVGSLSDPNSPAPVASPKETTTYIVTGLDSNGCAQRDTVKVTVIFRDHLLVPTAFSPNGDGRNDFFHIVNPSYHRLMEFRVFNRWGQEIFSTTDINGGWDGNWKGIPQPIGNYQYMIRVGAPDGNVESYKGEVTLVR